MKPQLIIKKRKRTTKPRFTILPNSHGLITGIEHNELSHICNLAWLRAYDELKKETRLEHQQYTTKILWILDTLKQSLHDEISRSYPPKREPSLKEKLRANEKERQWWNKFWIDVRK